MNLLNDINGLKREIKSLQEDIDFYKTKYEVAEFKLKEHIAQNSKEKSDLKEKIFQASKKSVLSESKEIKALLKKIDILTAQNESLSYDLNKLSNKLKEVNNKSRKNKLLNESIKDQTKKSAKEIREIELNNYLASLIEDIIDENGTLLPSVAMRIRSYTEQLKKGADLAVVQPFFEELIIAYDRIKQLEKSKLKKIS